MRIYTLLRMAPKPPTDILSFKFCDEEFIFAIYTGDLLLWSYKFEGERDAKDFINNLRMTANDLSIKMKVH